MPPPARNNRWVWYFAALVVLAAAAVGTLVWFGMRQQLKPAELERAWALWKARRPANYDMTVTKTITTPEVINVRVRGGKVVSVLDQGQPLEPRLYSSNDMDAWFGFIEDFLKADAKTGKRTFTKAVFDADDGHIRQYIRRVMGTPERLEIRVDLEAVDPQGRPGTARLGAGTGG